MRKFNPNDLCLEFTHGQIETRHLIKGIAKAELIGGDGPLVNLDRFQLALPFVGTNGKCYDFVRLCVSRLNETQHG